MFEDKLLDEEIGTKIIKNRVSDDVEKSYEIIKKTYFESAQGRTSKSVFYKEITSWLK